MEIDFEKIFKYLRIENALILLGVLSFLVSLYNEYIFGMKISFWFLFSGAIFRFYNISIVNGIFLNYMDKFRYKRKTLVFDKDKSVYNETEEYVVPFRKSWWIHLVDLILCLFLVLLLVYLYVTTN
ncbi:MAG: hypothetical protein PHT54_04410 [Candidatus Nanoarchaeia archaeon]|nr:hypothetical protein [Candidatus Nanoarchaeia archaeon]